MHLTCSPPNEDVNGAFLFMFAKLKCVGASTLFFLYIAPSYCVRSGCNDNQESLSQNYPGKYLRTVAVIATPQSIFVLEHDYKL